MNRLHALLQQPDGMHLAYPSNRQNMDRKTSEHVLMMEAIRMIEPDPGRGLRRDAEAAAELLAP